MDQLICHLLGDYVLQTDWMARTKTSNLFAAMVHSFFYSIPFTLITGISWTLVVILLTHAIIDRYRLARFIMHFKEWSWKKSSSKESTPLEIKRILLIVVDNTMHLVINFLAIKYLG